MLFRSEAEVSKKTAILDAKRLAEDLASARKAMVDLEAGRSSEVRGVLAFMGKTSRALVPFSFSPVRVAEAPQVVSDALPTLDALRAKIQGLEDAVGKELEDESRLLIGQVAEHVLACFQSRDPSFSLLPTMEGILEEIEESTRAGVQEAVQAVVARFNREAKGGAEDK